MIIVRLSMLITVFTHNSLGYSINYDSYSDLYPDNERDHQSSITPRNELPQYNDTLLEDLLNGYYNRYLSHEHFANWHSIFSDDMDSNNDGSISDEEILEKLKQGMKLIFTKVDKNNDQRITLDEASSVSLNFEDTLELFNFYSDIFLRRYYYHLYQILDTNDDGFLSVQEVEVQLRVNTNEQKNVVKEIFTYFDTNNDNKFSMDDVKPVLEQILSIYFKLSDTNDDGLIYFNDTDFNVSWKDITDILEYVKENFPPKGELDLNHFLIPFGFDLNRDGVINNLDVYSFFGPDTEILTIGKILKLLDQDQDGIYKFVDLKNFVVTFWSILDENHDMKLSMEDGLLLLKNKLGVSDDKISLVDGYVKYVKAYLMDEALRLIKFVFEDIDRNGNQEVTLQDVYWMPKLCFSRWRGNECFDFRRFPDAPEALDGMDVFPRSEFLGSPRWYARWEYRSFALLLSILDSPKFNNVKEFDWDGASKIENEIEDLAPKGETLLNDLRHKISAYKQIQEYLKNE